jgi:hypothetical protein
MGINKNVIRGEMNIKSERVTLEWDGDAVGVSPRFSKYLIKWLPKEETK